MRSRANRGAPGGDRPLVRAVYSRLLVEILAADGFRPAEILAGTGLTPAALDDPNRRIGHAQQLRIYRNAARRSRRPGLGFRLAARQRLSDHGVVGYAVQSSADLAQALRVVARYNATTGPLVELEARTAGGVTRIGLRESYPLREARALAFEEVLGVLALQILPLAVPPVRPLEVRVDDAAVDRRLYRRKLPCSVRFGAATTEIDLRTRDLRRPLRFADADTARVCEERCEDLLRRLGSRGELVDRVREVLLASPGRFPGVDEAARRLGMSGRTLRRRLFEEGVPFRNVLAGVRRDLALDYLRQSHLTADDVAALLGYANTPSFYREFRKWTGRTPAALRGRAEFP